MNRNELQESILGIALLFNEEIPNVTLHPKDFSGEYRQVFEYLQEEGGDLMTVASTLSIPTTRMIPWIDRESSPLFLRRYCDQLRDANIRLKAVELGGRVKTAASVNEIMGLIADFIAETEPKEKTEPVDMRTGLGSLNKELERKHRMKGQLLGMSTGIPELDEKTEGFHTGDLVVVAGPSSMGKTALAVGFLESVGRNKHPAIAFSCEMTVDQLLMRSLAGEAKVNFGRIRGAKFHDEDWGKMMRAFNVMNEWPIWIDDPAGISVQEIIRKIKRAKQKHGIKFVLIDYLQILEYDNAQENRELDRICRMLKNVAKDQDVCIVLLSQLNRKSEYEKRKPTMTDLRGSGAIENHSDVVLFPWRPAANCVECQERADGHEWQAHQLKAEIIIGKQRQGERNVSVPVIWKGEHVRFEPISRREE